VSNVQSVNTSPSTIFGVSPVLFYGGVGGIVAAIVIAMIGTVVALQQRGHKRPPKIETPPLTS
jgi:hypothetical protein